MELYLTEEEQVEQLKQWWKKYGVSIIVGVLLGLMAMYGWQAWQAHEVRHTRKASLLYGQLLAKVNEGNTDGVTRQGKQIIKDYPKTPYAALASLFLADQAATESQLIEAEKYLRWSLENSRFKSLKQTARIRLARVLFAQGQPAKALETLQTLDDDSYAVLVDEVRGDVLLGTGKSAEALKAYEKALVASQGLLMLRPLLEMKLDSLRQNTNTQGA